MSTSGGRGRHLRGRRAKRLSTRASLVSSVLIALGVIVAVTPIYSEFIETGFVAGSQDSMAADESERLAFDAASGAEIQPDVTLADFEVFGVMYAARLGENYRRPIAQGTDVEQVLNRVGIGHYKHTALPYQTGNFALAAHRTTHGGSFNNIDQFVAGDKIFIETNWGWFGYEVIKTDVVTPKELWVTGPDPLKLGAAHYLTLTTCTPRYTAEKRLVVWAKQVAQYPRSGGAPAELAHFFKK